MTDEERKSPDPEKETAEFRWASDVLEARLTNLKDRCKGALHVSWDRCRLPHPSENSCRAMVEEWRIAMNVCWNDLPKLLRELNRALNRGPDEVRRIEIESACQTIAEAFEPLASLSERWRDHRLIRRWRMVFSELAETNLFVLEQVSVLPQRIRESGAARVSGTGAGELSLKLIPPPNFPPSGAAVRAVAQAEPPIICRRRRVSREGFISDMIAFALALLIFSPLLLIPFLLLWPFFALAVIIWVWLLLLGAAGALAAKFNPAPKTMATLEKAAVAISLVMLLVLLVWAGLTIDHPMFQ